MRKILLAFILAGFTSKLENAIAELTESMPDEFREMVDVPSILGTDQVEKIPLFESMPDEFREMVDVPSILGTDQVEKIPLLDPLRDLLYDMQNLLDEVSGVCPDD